MTETIINLETVNPIEFFGVNNGKLDLLKKKFPLLKILSRGTQLKLSGAPEQIDTAKEKIDLIIQYLERNGHLSEIYFQQIQTYLSLCFQYFAQYIFLPLIKNLLLFLKEY